MLEQVDRKDNYTLNMKSNDLNEKVEVTSKDIANFINTYCDFREDIDFSLDKFCYDFALDVCKKIESL